MEVSVEDGGQEPGVTFDWTEAESVSAAVVDAVASATGDDPMEMAPLYAAVDPDSLDALFGSCRYQRGKPGPVVEFSYNGAEVRVSDTGNGYVFTDD